MGEYSVLLQGVVDSSAYGLADENSDIDTLGMFAYPTQAFWGLSQPKETIVHTDPDETLHEVAKYWALAIKANPTALELLWLPEYTVTSWAGQELVSIRTAFLFETGVRNSYLGYASQQFHRIRSRGDNSFSADARHQTAKHARHLWRLALQGANLHRYGYLGIRLDAEQAKQCREFGERVEAAGSTWPRSTWPGPRISSTSPECSRPSRMPGASHSGCTYCGMRHLCPVAGSVIRNHRGGMIEE